MTQRSIAAHLYRARIAIRNARINPAIAGLLAPYGYDRAALDHGYGLLMTARAALCQQQDAHGLALDATARLQRVQGDAIEAYQGLAQIARTIFQRVPAHRSALGLRGVMPRARAAFLLAADTLFQNAQQNEVIAAALARRGYPAERVVGEYQRVGALKQAIDQQALAIATARMATQQARAAFGAMQEWFSEFRAVARVALRPRPQLLIALAISTYHVPVVAPSERADEVGGLLKGGSQAGVRLVAPDCLAGSVGVSSPAFGSAACLAGVDVGQSLVLSPQSACPHAVCAPALDLRASALPGGGSSATGADQTCIHRPHSRPFASVADPESSLSQSDPTIIQPRDRDVHPVMACSECLS